MSLNLPICHACNTTLSSKQRTNITENVTNPPYLGAQLKKCDLRDGKFEVATPFGFCGRAIWNLGGVTSEKCVAKWKTTCVWPYYFQNYTP